MLFPLMGLVFGIALGIGSGIVFPPGYSAYAAIGILVCLDSVLGGIAANLQRNFRGKAFATGLFGNAIFAMALIWFGNHLSIDLYQAAVFVYAFRMFNNFSKILFFLLNKKKKGLMIDSNRNNLQQKNKDL